MSIVDVFVKAAQAKVRSAAAQALVTGTVTQITLGTSVYSTAGVVSTDVANSRLILNQSIPGGCEGMYLILGQIQFAASAAGSRYTELRVNGVRIAYQTVAAANIPTRLQTLGMYYHDGQTGPGVTMFGYQNSGGNLNVDATDTWLHAIRVG